MDSKPVLTGAASLASLEPTINVYTWSRSAGKRLFDVAFAGFCLLFTWPLMLLAALLIKSTSPGPVFFRQMRAGQDGKTFELLKFRSMTHGRLNAGPGVTRQGDPRIFPAGRWLRKWKVDELPQFINVIRGDMSLVGPRPFPAYHLAAFDPEFQALRATVPPGLTGLWQISSRSSGDLDRQRAEDCFYIKNRSLWLDLYILIATPPAVIRARGAK